MRRRPVTLLEKFSLLSFLCIVGITGAACAAGAELLKRHLVKHDAAVVGDLARILLTHSVPVSYFTSFPKHDPGAHERALVEIAASVDVVRTKVYDAKGRVLWSDDAEIIGRQFDDNDELKEALQGHTLASVIRPEKEEHEPSLRAFDRLEEIYIPIRYEKGGPVVGALEIYRHPPAFFAILDQGWAAVWILGGGGGLLLYLTLFGVVRQASGKQQKLEHELTTHARTLESRVADRTRALTTLYEASVLLHTTNDVERLLTLIASGAREIVGAGWAGVGRLVGGDIRFQADSGARAVLDAPGAARTAADDVAGRAYRTGEPVIVNESSSGAGGGERGTILCVPMKSRNTTVGVIQVCDKTGGLPFTEDDARLLATFAAQAATILENTGLFNEIKSTKEYLEHLIESSADAIVVVDARGRLTLINRAGQQLFGYRDSTAVRRSVRRFWTSGRSDFREFLRSLGETGRLQNYETELRDADRKILTVSISASLLRDPAGRVTGALAVVRDVSDIQRFQEQIIRTERLAATGLLAAGVAHEVGNPLACISALSQVLCGRASDPVVLRGLADIQLHVRRIENIVHDLTQLSRPASREMQVSSLNELVQDAVALAQHNPAVQRMHIESALDPARPTISAVPDRLLQVFLNLIMNAADAGGDLAVSTTVDDHAARVRFADTGRGMSPEELERLFDPFFSTKDAGKHAGLGLFVSHEIVRQHGGVILAESRVEGGSTFTVVLPGEA